ncbi:MAG: hypothetical protein ABIQ99_07455 [Thermoflexales bacterium]
MDAVSAPPISSPAATALAATTLSRRARPLALIVWMAVTALSAVVFIRGIELLLSSWLDLGRIAKESPRFLGPPERVALLQLGLSVDAFRAGSAGLDIAFVAAYTAIAFVLVWRKRGDWMALLVSGALIVYGVSASFSTQTLLTQPQGSDLGTRLVNLLSTVCVPILAYLFPDGRFVPRWTRPLTVLWLILAIATLIVPGWDVSGWNWLALTVLYAVGLATGIVAQVYRYRKVATVGQRQQVKWAVLAFILAAGLYFALPLLALAFPTWYERGRNLLIFETVFVAAFYVSQLAVPLGLTLSILRFRLWDVDLLINRTLVYGVVTGVLFVVFEAVTFTVDKTLGEVLDAGGFLNSVVPALVTGLVFSPVRDKTQRFVDKRFYREKVDARKAFAEFGRALRLTVDLNEALQFVVVRLSAHMHAAHATVFLRGEDGSLERAANVGTPPVSYNTWMADRVVIDLLEAGLTAPGNEDGPYRLFVPLTLPPVADLDGARGTLLVGVLALGPRLSELGYSTEDQALLVGLAEQTGTALYVAQLVRERATA